MTSWKGGWLTLSICRLAIIQATTAILYFLLTFFLVLFFVELLYLFCRFLFFCHCVIFSFFFLFLFDHSCVCVFDHISPPLFAREGNTLKNVEGRRQGVAWLFYI